MSLQVGRVCPSAPFGIGSWAARWDRPALPPPSNSSGIPPKTVRPLWCLLLIGCALLSRSVCALEWQAGATGRSAALPVPSSGKIGFTRLSPALTGISFTNLLSVGRYTTNQIYLNGSGVAAGDVDGDGWVDLYFCGLDNANVLYRNLGNWKFQDITQGAGVACANLDATGAALVDLDGDGIEELLVDDGEAGHTYVDFAVMHLRDARYRMGQSLWHLRSTCHC